jgi:hypothetical protein
MGKIGGMKSFCAAGVTISGIELTGSSRLANWVAATPRCQRFGELRWLRNSR